MCEKQKRIEELEIENVNLYRTLSEAYKFNAEERKLNAEERKLNVEQRNIDSQLIWRPWQVVLIPILLGVLALVAAIAR
ncbi:conserved hypothetical protein [Vibrio crassostreae]|uniref:Uncharacterized protein n=3 Tax=Vibrionaceae TaxID=641 RepID=A0A4R3P8G9_9VIBR|nr:MULTISPECIES: hypothetical protein [Vibrionaceae]MCQ1060974.1 hypothetical protein [Photobacterium sp. ZSDE20]MDD1828940.1 hypothetical protein [Photobacterium sp. ZSDE20]MDH5919882.1 hypothetical protein [Vibrio splendidus]MDH5936595.1 hypothetical protein [Vibrio splendidus]MDH5951245.1 hypothetical protein [Vibrio crassostreae]